ncbi:MAG: hypothetical protein RML32_04125 [Gammaproteobacteria bacterium]|nr:hypothetical protein [Gammaproteobacteria bacterium]
MIPRDDLCAALETLGRPIIIDGLEAVGLLRTSAALDGQVETDFVYVLIAPSDEAMKRLRRGAPLLIDDIEYRVKRVSNDGSGLLRVELVR